MKSKVDILVIGGGVTGLGVALETRARGLSVLLLDQGELGQGTSANSLRIIHGGLRYLQQLNLRRVRESAREQARIIRGFSELVVPLPCAMPLSKGGARSRLPMTIASLLYSVVTRGVGAELSAVQVLNKDEAVRRVPALCDIAPQGAFVWHDALLLDHGKFIGVLSDALQRQGGEVRANTRVARVVPEAGWTVVSEGGEEFSCSAVVNAAGPWIQSVVPRDAPREFGNLPAGWCEAINLEFDFALDPAVAIAGKSQSGRLLFSVPRGEGSALGTWYYPLLTNHDARADTGPDENEIESFLGEAREVYRDSRFERGRVRRIDRGVLPMIRNSASGPVLYGRHLIRDWNGFIQLMSTKYTTFRLLGEEAVSAAAPYC